MTNAASGAITVARILDDIARADRGRLLSALIARLSSFSLAEDALQDAMISAMSHWTRSGIPSAPDAWLLQVAFRKGIDRIREAKARRRMADDLAPVSPGEVSHDEPDMIPDERLRLVFTCCHPALEPKSRVALTLRTLGGLSTGEIARAFLDQEATMGQRISRAKAKIAAAGIRFAVPEPDDWAERLDAVLSVVYLIFNAGYSAGPSTGRDLAEEALWLGRLLDQLRPGDPEIEGFRALMMLAHARRAARVDGDGVSVPLDRQDRALWDRVEIDAGLGLVETALARGKPGPYQIKAAISACHCEGAVSDWPQIVALYDVLLEFEPTAVVRLNRAVALCEAGAPERAARDVEALGEELAGYQPFHAARADVLARLGHIEASRAAYAEAIRMASSPADARLLERRRAALQPVVFGVSGSDPHSAQDPS
jgi:RNA polymerase sigma factor (sigma-70 family)